ncbi:AraC family transcriptional regulator ligand-binding domain-containing protein [Streptomyces sp. NPDC005485]|uniref:AraC family transcriptional regulator ligand-binding domain-containing protein n=1 Tax=Streptomyces sp. NPDC005485 TaxID=3155591 RepID=UPI0033BDB134
MTRQGDYDRFLPNATVAAVLADAAEALGRPDFGMRLAREQGIQILGPVAVIIHNAETFASAVDGVARYLHNIAPTTASSWCTDRARRCSRSRRPYVRRHIATSGSRTAFS